MRKWINFTVLLFAVCAGLIVVWYSISTRTQTSEPQNQESIESSVSREKADKAQTWKLTPLEQEEIDVEDVMRLTGLDRNDARRVYRFGRDKAEIKLTFHVTDSTGKDVEGAVFTTCSITNKAGGITDSNGLYTAIGRTTGEVVYIVQKDGYYKTHARRFYASNDGRTVEDGKWVPYHRTIEVTLKEQRNPIPMYVKNASIRLPKQGEPFGYDFEKGDLVAPRGTGEQADLFFTCSATDWEAPAFRKELRIAAAQKGGGVIANAKDTYSQFQSRHEAQEDGYEPQFEFVMDTKKREAVSLDPDSDETRTHYLTFRSRVVRNATGEIVSARYGKILVHPNTGHPGFSKDPDNPEGAFVSLQYYFNPTPNDRNLEFDGKNNMFKPDWKDTNWPHEP